jgi:hypothetical protein
MSLKLAVALAAMVIGSAPGYAAGVVNLVTNGDFDSAGGATNGTQLSSGVGTSILTGWTMGARTNAPTTPGLGFLYTSGLGDSTTQTQSGIYLYGPKNGNANGLTDNSGAVSVNGTNVGGNYIALDADSNVNGLLSQNITGLTVGQDYILSFYWASAELTDPNTGITTEQVQASLGSQVRSTAIQTTAQKGFDPWQQSSIYFTAQSAIQTLSFLAVGTPNGLPPTVLLDAVSLVQAPEPSTWAIMLVGVSGLAGFSAMRRRSRGVSISA